MGNVYTRALTLVAATPTGKQALLKPEHRFSTWLDDSLRNGDLKERRSVAGDFDSRKYWLGMATGSWKGAEAEQRASMQEGVSGDGGYLVRRLLLASGLTFCVTLWCSRRVTLLQFRGSLGSTLTLPVMVTDPVVQTPAETVDVYPPSSDATVNRYQFTARPYSEFESLSWELLEDSAIDIAEVITMNMAKRMATQIQTDFIYGAGTGIQGFTGASGLLTGIEGGTV